MSYLTRVRDAWRTHRKAQAALDADYEDRIRRTKNGDTTAFEAENDPTYLSLNDHTHRTHQAFREALLNRPHTQNPALFRIYDFEEHLGDAPPNLWTLCGITVEREVHEEEKHNFGHDRCDHCDHIAAAEEIDWDQVQ